MSIQSMLLGLGISSQITAIDATVSEIAFTPTTVGITFNSLGSEFTTVNGSNTVLTNWVNPPNTAEQWEIRATVFSGLTPTTGTIGTWEALTTTRAWTLSRSAVGLSESVLTFEFRRVGDTPAEVTLSPTTLIVEILDIF